MGEVRYVTVRKPEPPEQSCRTPGCSNKNTDGLQGFCGGCSRTRQIEGRWETIPLAEATKKEQQQ